MIHSTNPNRLGSSQDWRLVLYLFQPFLTFTPRCRITDRALFAMSLPKIDIQHHFTWRIRETLMVELLISWTQCLMFSILAIAAMEIHIVSSETFETWNLPLLIDLAVVFKFDKTSQLYLRVMESYTTYHWSSWGRMCYASFWFIPIDHCESTSSSKSSNQVHQPSPQKKRYSSCRVTTRAAMVLRYLPSLLSRLPGFELLAAGESIRDDGGLMLVGMLSPVLDVSMCSYIFWIN